MSGTPAQTRKGLFWFVAGLPIALSATASAAYAEEGMAAYYSNSFQGKRTAEGGTFDQDGLTAATHEGFAFGTKVKVTNLKTGESVVVTVTDRIPARNRNIIDLSRKAAHEIGIERSGRARVSVEALP